MALLQAIFNVIVPVVIVAAVGAILGRNFDLSGGTISKISLYALTPALALETLLTTEVSAGDAFQAIGSFTLVTFLGVLLGAVCAIGLPPAQRRAVMVTTSTANSGNMGLPIALFALGQAGFEQSVLLFITSTVLTFIVVPPIFGSAGVRSALMSMARMPALWAMVVGVGMRLLGWSLPTGVMSGVSLLGQATLPMVLLALGIQLGTTGRPRLNRAVWTGSVLRVLVMPALALGLGLLLGIRGIPLQTLVLTSSMPVAVNAYLLSMEYKGDVKTVADTVTVTTVTSFLTISLVAWVLPWIGGL